MSSPVRRENPLGRRLRLTGLGWFYQLLFPVAITLFVLGVVSVSLVFIGVGAFFLLAVVPLVGAYAGAERVIAGRILGERIESPYRRRRGGGPFALLGTWARDPARWRDLLMLPIAFSAGFVMVVLVDAFFWAGSST